MINRSTKSFSHEFFRLDNKIETMILPCAKMKRIPAKTETKIQLEFFGWPFAGESVHFRANFDC